MRLHNRFRRSGDGFLRCEDGRMRWGLFGAAGALFVVRGDESPSVLLQLRSARAHEGGTWSCPGGAIDKGESAIEAAIRESTEEIGEPPHPWTLRGAYEYTPASDWRYITSVIEVTRQFGAPTNFETDEVRWCHPEEVDALVLHPGFAVAWPHLRKIALA